MRPGRLTLLHSLSFFTRLWQPSLVVSQQALNTFLTRPIDKREAGSTHHVDQSEPSSNSQNQTSLNGVKINGSETSTRPLAALMEGEISVEEILCPHGRLDPGEAADMKRIDRVSHFPHATLSHWCSQSYRLRTNR